ncbi:hypothetical protein LWI29_033029 [Acer saccharum]|uniref:Pyrrolo-quinoline quinone repeat domain-containing protein n=1 Tax=Acer saccharum TaxID=4024 RepID=A0AA39T2F2_ACESA|nr:hypothetical protein LWI29_033029 [Acer saccharum]
MWCKRLKVRPKGTYVQNGKLVLEKRRADEKVGHVREEETSSSSAEDLSENVFLDSNRERGECSKSLSGSNLSSKPKRVSFSSFPESPSSFQVLNRRVDLCVDLGQIAVGRLDGKYLAGVREREEVSLDSLATKEEFVRATLEAESRFQSGSNVVQSEIEEVEVASSDSLSSKEEMIRVTMEAEKERLGERQRVVSGGEMVRSRVAEEMMEEEYDNEVGVGDGRVGQGQRQRGRSRTRTASRHGMKTRQSSSSLVRQDLRISGSAVEEANRVMETGRILGFDFTRDEEEVLAAISNREEEDRERFQALSGINFNSIVTLDIDSGRIAWAKQLGDYDVFYFPCLVPDNPDCPPGPNLDADFGEAPMLLTIYANGTIRDVVVAVQKSGFAWALNRDNGEIVWFKLAGPGGEEGGGQWGAATDGR